MPSESPSPEKRKSLARRLFKWAVRLAVVGVVLLAIMVTAAWFSRDWLMAKTEALLLQKLDEREVYISYGTMDYQVLRGLLISDLTVWDDAEKTRPLIELGNVAFRPDLVFLCESRKLAGVLSIRDTDLRLYSGGVEVTHVAELDFDAELEPDGLTVEDLDGSVFGVDFDARGFVRLGKGDRDRDRQPDAEPENGAVKQRKGIDFAFLSKVAEALAFESQGEQPDLDIEFTIDRNADDPVVVSARLEGESLAFRGVPLESVDLALQFSEAAKTVTPTRMDLAHRGGRISGELMYQLVPRTLTLSGVESNLNLIAVAEDLPIDLSGYVGMISLTEKHPRINLDGTLALGGFKQSSFTVEIPQPVNVAVQLNEASSVEVADLHGRVLYDQGLVAVSDLEARLFGVALALNGEVKPRVQAASAGQSAGAPPAERAVAAEKTETADASFPADPGSPEIEAEAPPEVAKPPLTDRLARIFSIVESWTSFESTAEIPVVTADFSVQPGAEEPVAVSGTLSGEQFTWHGAAFDSADIDFAYSQSAKAVDVPRFELGYGGGSLKGGAHYAITSRQLHLTAVRSQADLIALALDLDFGLEQLLAPYEVGGPTTLLVDGRMDFSDFSSSDFTVDCVDPVPVKITLGERVVEMQSFRGKAHVSGNQVTAEGVEIELGGGFLRWDGSYDMASVAYDGTVRFSGLPIAELLKIGGKEPVPGVLDGVISGNGDSRVVMREGEGELTVTETETLRIPLVGGLLKVFAQIAPVFGNTTDESVTMTFVTRSGVLSTDDLVAKGSGFLIEVEADLDWNAQTIHFLAKAKLDGIGRLLTAIASEVLEIEGEGPLNDIKLSAKNFNVGLLGDAAQGLFSVGGEGVRVLTDGVGKVTGGATDGVRIVTDGVIKATEGAAEGVTDGVKRVRDGLRGLLPFGRKDDEEEAEGDGTPMPASEAESTSAESAPSAGNGGQ